MSAGRKLYTVLLIALSIAFMVIVSAAVTGDISLAGVGRTLLWLAAAAVGLIVYFLPTIIAVYRESPIAGSVFVVNLFLGWNVPGLGGRAGDRG
jgi:Superinfection immunity protein